MEEIKQEAAALLSKVWVWLMAILVGLVGKISFDILQGKQMSPIRVAACIGLGLFIGFISGLICVYKEADMTIAIAITGIATSMSEKIMVVIASIKTADLKQFLLNLFNIKK